MIQTIQLSTSFQNMSTLELTPTFPNVLVVAECPFCRELLPHELIQKSQKANSSSVSRMIKCLNCHEHHREILTDSFE